jgi:hypothetical protein
MSDEPEVVRIVYKYRKELDHRESTALSDITRAWVKVESELVGELEELAREILERQAQGLEIYPQYIHTTKRYLSLREQLRKELDWYDNKVIDIITENQTENINLGLESANEIILKSYDVDSPSWTKLNTSAFEASIGMLKDGSPLNRLFKADYSDSLDELNKALSNGLAIGKGYKQIAQDMLIAAQMMSYQRSVVIARTEINRAYRLATTEQYRKSGVVTAYKRCVYKPTACLACLMLDGQVYNIETEFDDHPSGKCAIIAITTGGNYPQWQTGQEWFEELSPEEQLSKMGLSRFTAWKEGQISLDSLAYIKENPVWGGAPALRTLADLGIEKVGKVEK